MPPTTWGAVAAGPRPSVPYIREHHYVTPSGGSQRLPDAKLGVSGVLPFAGGLLVANAMYFEGSNGIDLVKDGRADPTWPSSRHCSSGSPVASAGGSFVAWSTVRCPESFDDTVGAIHRARADGRDERTHLFGPGLAWSVGFLGRQVVYNVGFEDGAWITDFARPPRRIPGVERVLDVDDRTGLLIAGRGDYARLVVATAGAVRWRIRVGDLYSFSPDGTKVLAVSRREVSILRSSDGAVVTTFAVPDGVHPSELVWETERSLLTLVDHARRVAIVRVRLDGSLERATAPLPTGRHGGPYGLL